MTKTRTSETGSQTAKAGATFPKTDLRYWRGKLFRRSNEEWHCQIGFGGRQDRWPLRTANHEQAAAKARDIWLSLQTHGFEATEAKFKPWTVAPEPEGKAVTVGDFIKAASAVATVRPTTLTHYLRKFRFLVSQIGRIKGTKARHDYVHGGADKWRGQVENMPLAELTPQKISEWRVRYVSRFDSQPMKRQQAQQTAASIIRNAKSLFAPRILRGLTLTLPSPLPFEGVDIGKRPRTRYKSKVDAGALAAAAYGELKDREPEQFKIFLLAFGAGLRRGEIDRLTWKAFNWQRATLGIEANEYGLAKTEASNEEIDLGTDLLDYFKEQMKNAAGEFVITSKAAPTAAPHWNRYRCDGHFKDLLAWLRSKGVTARNPLHTLRKEFGSLINQKFGIYAASAALRHSNISVTRESYVDRKERIALDLSEVMQAKQTPG
jgi:integrase